MFIALRAYFPPSSGGAAYRMSPLTGLWIDENVMAINMKSLRDFSNSQLDEDDS
jgi:hypothetical protein